MNNNYLICEMCKKKRVDKKTKSFHVYAIRNLMIFCDEYDKKINFYVSCRQANYESERTKLCITPSCRYTTHMAAKFSCDLFSSTRDAYIDNDLSHVLIQRIKMI